MNLKIKRTKNSIQFKVENSVKPTKNIIVYNQNKFIPTQDKPIYLSYKDIGDSLLILNQTSFHFTPELGKVYKLTGSNLHNVSISCI